MAVGGCLPSCPPCRGAARIREAHFYEEPAIDVYSLHALPLSAGEGRIGTLSEPVRLDRFAAAAKSVLLASRIQVVGEPTATVRRVAIVCGAGGDFIPDAIRKEADVFLTGELRFHDCLAAKAQGLNLVLPGHHATERVGVEDLARRLQAQFPDLSVWASRREQDPLWHC